MKVAELLTRIRHAIKMRDFRAAEILLYKILHHTPHFVTAYLLLGIVYQKRGQYGKAKESFRKVLSYQPENLDALNNLGIVYKETGNYEEALTVYNKALEIDAERPDVHFNIGNVFKAVSDYETAMEEYNTAIDLKPEYTPPYNNLGVILEAMDRKEEAVNAYKTGLRYDSNNPNLLLNLGRLMENRRKYDRAKTQYEMALKAKPGWIDALSMLGGLQGKMGDHKNAINTLNSVLKINPQNFNALFNIGLEYGRLNDVDKAVDYYKRALETNPEYRSIMLSFGSFLESEGYFVESLKELEELMRRDPDNPEARFAYVNVLISMGRYVRALKSIRGMLRFDPSNEKALQLLMTIYLMLKKYIKADKIFATLGKKNAGNYLYDFKIQEIITDKESLKTHFEDIKRLISVFDEDINFILFWGEIYFNHKLYDQALELFLLGCEIKPRFVKSHHFIARILIQQGKIREAMDMLTKIINIQGTRITKQDMQDLMGTLDLYEGVLEKYDREKIDSKGKYSIKNYFDEHGDMKTVIIPDKSIEEDALEPIIDIGEPEPLLQVNEEEELLRIDEMAEEIEEDIVEINDQEPPPMMNLLENQELYDESMMLKILQAQQELLNDISHKLKKVEKDSGNKQESLLEEMATKEGLLDSIDKTKAIISDDNISGKAESFTGSQTGMMGGSQTGMMGGSQTGMGTGKTGIAGQNTGQAGMMAGNKGLEEMASNLLKDGTDRKNSGADKNQPAMMDIDKDSLMSKIMMTQQEILLNISQKINSLKDNFPPVDRTPAVSNRIPGMLESITPELLNGLQKGINKLADSMKNQYKIIPIPLGTDVSFTPDGKAVVKPPDSNMAKMVEEKLQKASNSLESLEAKVLRQEMRDYIRKIRDKLEDTKTFDEKTGKAVFKPAKKTAGKEEKGLPDDILKAKLEEGKEKLEHIRDKIYSAINKNRIEHGEEPLHVKGQGTKAGGTAFEEMAEDIDAADTAAEPEKTAEVSGTKTRIPLRKRFTLSNILNRIIDFIPGSKIKQRIRRTFKRLLNIDSNK
ncbi:MAG: tetratricopeptide repeat protein [Spirochaetales bacterium]|nr:tetratricopeptide repeat protein [Spirochaetales bacterium]